MLSEALTEKLTETERLRLESVLAMSLRTSAEVMELQTEVLYLLVKREFPQLVKYMLDGDEPGGSFRDFVAERHGQVWCLVATEEDWREELRAFAEKVGDDTKTDDRAGV
jgi:hypothetical protein